MSILIAFSLTVAILIALFIQDQIISTRRQIELVQDAAQWRAEMNEQNTAWMNQMQREHEEWMREFENKTNA